MDFTLDKRPSLYCGKLWKQEEIFWHSILAGCLQCTTQATRCCIISKAHVRLLKSTTLHGRSLSRTFRTPGQILNAIPVELNISQCGGHAVKILRNPAKEGFRDHIADESRQQGTLWPRSLLVHTTWRLQYIEFNIQLTTPLFKPQVQAER